MKYRIARQWVLIHAFMIVIGLIIMTQVPIVYDYRILVVFVSMIGSCCIIVGFCGLIVHIKDLNRKYCNLS